MFEWFSFMDLEINKIPIRTVRKVFRKVSTIEKYSMNSRSLAFKNNLLIFFYEFLDT